MTLEVNPPTVQVTDDQSREAAAGTNVWELVATQVGLLQSRSLAERVAEDLSLANNPNFVDQSGEPSGRLNAATARVQSNLDVVPPDVGTLIRFNYVSPDPQIAAQVANGVAEVLHQPDAAAAL